MSFFKINLLNVSRYHNGEIFFSSAIPGENSCVECGARVIEGMLIRKFQI